MNSLSKESVTFLQVEPENAGQRIDNFLFTRLKGVPKSHIYRILRSGEVRVNKKRADASYRISAGDAIRIPPIRTAAPAKPIALPVAPQLADCVLYEDEALLAINKPSGMAVHGGSGISWGVVEQFRQERPQSKFLELAHRLDKETSGILLLAKKRSALLPIHQAMREGEIEKRYLALVKGKWKSASREVRLPLHKYVTTAGERRVSVSEQGRAAHTVFRLRKLWQEFSLLEAELHTGRTHQIRVHLAHLGFPIAGDDKYGDFEWNRKLQKMGLKRMFLHAYEMVLKHPLSGQTLRLEAPLSAELADFLDSLDSHAQTV